MNFINALENRVKNASVLVFALLLVACSQKPDLPTKIVNVNPEAIYWHEYSNFTYVMRNNNTLSFNRLCDGLYEKNITVKLGNENHIKCDIYRYGMNGRECNCSITVKSIDEIKTADWNHGKFGKGKTLRIDG